MKDVKAAAAEAAYDHFFNMDVYYLNSMNQIRRKLGRKASLQHLVPVMKDFDNAMAYLGDVKAEAADRVTAFLVAAYATEQCEELIPILLTFSELLKKDPQHSICFDAAVFIQKHTMPPATAKEPVRQQTGLKPARPVFIVHTGGRAAPPAFDQSAG